MSDMEGKEVKENGDEAGSEGVSIMKDEKKTMPTATGLFFSGVWHSSFRLMITLGEAAQ